MEPALTIIIAIFGSTGFWALMVDCGAYQGNPYCRTDSNRDDRNSCVDLRGQLDSPVNARACGDSAAVFSIDYGCGRPSNLSFSGHYRIGCSVVEFTKVGKDEVGYCSVRLEGPAQFWLSDC